MSEYRKILIFDEIEPTIQTEKANDGQIDIYGQNELVVIYEPGPRGSVGPQGPQGFSGAGEPFFVIQSGSLYATTASIAFGAYISSSMVPWSGGFNIGSLEYPWNKLYLSSSLTFAKNGITDVEINPGPHYIDIGNTRITTSSIGFGIDPVIMRIADTYWKFNIRSGSTSASFNDSGVFAIGDYQYLPPPAEGGLIKFGNDFYIGI